MLLLALEAPGPAHERRGEWWWEIWTSNALFARPAENPLTSA